MGSSSGDDKSDFESRFISPSALKNQFDRHGLILVSLLPNELLFVRPPHINISCIHFSSVTHIKVFLGARSHQFYPADCVLYTSGSLHVTFHKRSLFDVKQRLSWADIKNFVSAPSSQLLFFHFKVFIFYS
jgi:hypothetical protein